MSTCGTATEDKDKVKSKSGELQLKSNLKTVLMSNICLPLKTPKRCFLRLRPRKTRGPKPGGFIWDSFYVFFLLLCFDWPLYFTNPYSQPTCGLRMQHWRTTLEMPSLETKSCLFQRCSMSIFACQWEYYIPTRSIATYLCGNACSVS